MKLPKALRKLKPGDETPKLGLGSLVLTQTVSALFPSKDADKGVLGVVYQAPQDPIDKEKLPCFALVCLGVVADIRDVNEDVVSARFTEIDYWRADKVRDEIAAICKGAVSAESALAAIKDVWKVAD